MFEGYVTPLLKRLLNRYLHDVDVDQIPLLGGDIVITNVSLRVDVIQSLIPVQLPFEIGSGVVRTLTVRIPWTGLQSSSIQVELNQVEITLQPWENRRRRSSFGSTASLPSSMSWPDDSSRRPSDASFNSAAPSSNAPSHDSSDATSGGGGESWTMSFLSSLLHNISVDIKNAVLRFETPTCVVSLTFKQLLFNRTDESWQAAFSEPHGASKCTRSLLTATDVAVCVDPVIGKRRHFEEPVISRMKVMVRMTQYGTPLLRGSDIDVDTFHVILGTVSASLTTEQCSAIIDIMSKLMHANATSENSARVNSSPVAPSSHSSEPLASHSPHPDKQHDKPHHQPTTSKKNGWLQSAWMLLQEEDTAGEFNDQGQPVALVKAPAGSCLRISVSKVSVRLRGPVGVGPSPSAIASTVFESSSLEFERATLFDVPTCIACSAPSEASKSLKGSRASTTTDQSQVLLCIGSIMIFGTTGCAVFDCVGTAACAVPPPVHAVETDATAGAFGPIYLESSGIRPSRERTVRASAHSAIVFGHRGISQMQNDEAAEESMKLLSGRHSAYVEELLLRCSGMNVSLQPQTVMFLQTFFSLVEFHLPEEDGSEGLQPHLSAPKASSMLKEPQTDQICNLMESFFGSLTNQLFWLDIGPCSVMLPFVPTPQHPTGCSLVFAMDRLHFASTYSPDLIENDHRDVLAEFFVSNRVPMSLSINAGTFSLRLEHNAATDAQQLLLPFSAQCIVMHETGGSTLSANIASLQVAVSERSINHIQLLWGVWLQHFFHLQSNFDHQLHYSFARPSISASIQSPGSSSTDIRLQMLDLHFSRSASAFEVQLSLKSMEASGLVTLVPAPLAPHISESPKHLIAIFGKKFIGVKDSIVTDLEFNNSNGGWKWKSSLGGCNLELLQHTMAPWLVLQEMCTSYAKMKDSAQRNRTSDLYRGSPWHFKRSLSHPSSSSNPRSLAHQLDDVAVDIPAQPIVDIRKENDSLRLLLGSYESHFSRMRQQLQQLLPSGLISRDMDVTPFSSSKSSAAFSSSGISSMIERFCPSVFSRTRKRDSGPGGIVWFRSVRGASNRLLVLILVYVVCLHVMLTWCYLLSIGKSAPSLSSLNLPNVFRNK